MLIRMYCKAPVYWLYEDMPHVVCITHGASHVRVMRVWFYLIHFSALFPYHCYIWQEALGTEWFFKTNLSRITQSLWNSVQFETDYWINLLTLRHEPIPLTCERVSKSQKVKTFAVFLILMNIHNCGCTNTIDQNYSHGFCKCL